MKRIMLLRHAHTETPSLQKKDYERTLTRIGENEAANIGKALSNNHNLIPELIISSPAKRAKETVQIITRKMDYKKEILWKDKIYSGEMEEILNCIGESNNKINNLLVVGHNPAIESCFHFFTGTYKTISPATLSIIDVDLEKWDDIFLFGTKNQTDNFKIIKATKVE